MKTTISQSLQRDTGLSSLVDEASKLLDTVIGHPGNSVSEQWNIVNDPKGRPTVTLDLSDWTGSVSTTFEPAELARPYHLYDRLHRLWGDLLRVRSDRMIRTLNESISKLMQADSGDGGYSPTANISAAGVAGD